MVIYLEEHKASSPIGDFLSKMEISKAITK